MDSVQVQYMSINHFLMRFIGQWPYQENWRKALIQVVFAPLVFAQAVIQICKFSKRNNAVPMGFLLHMTIIIMVAIFNSNCCNVYAPFFLDLGGGGMITAFLAGDIDVAMESSSPFVISLMCICKYINYTYNHKQMKRLTVIMADDWDMYSKSSQEYDILCRNYDIGRKVAIGYAASLYGSMAPFMAVPVILNTASYLGLYNISEGRPLMFPSDYLLDVEKYYYPLLVHSYIGTLGFVSIVVAIDSMLVFHVQHECGMCEILGYRLARITDATTLAVDVHPSKEKDIAYRHAKECVIMHSHIIEYAKSLENANTTSYFFQLGFNMIGMTFTIFQAVVKLSDPKQALRYVSFTVTLLSVLFLESWPGQQLCDYTDKIFAHVTSGNWYYASLRVRRVLNIMLIRSYKPVRISAGKLYTLNLENFSSVVRTSFSYFTVLCSMQ